MRRLITRIGSLAAVTMLALTAAQPVQAAQSVRSSGAALRAADAAAYFEFTDVTRQTFVFKLTDPNRIQQARDILSGKEKDAVHVLARIEKRTAPYNPAWSYHVNPDTVQFFAFAIEVCDATIPYVEDYLDEAGGAFLPGLYWCDWSSRLTRELPAA